MSDILSGDTVTPMESPSGFVPIGAELARARVALGLTASDVASQLKVSARKIELLEAEQWGELPEVPYLRGLIRNYAKVLQIDAAPLVLAFDERVGASTKVPELSLPPSLRTKIPRRQAGSTESSLQRLMIFGACACAVIAVMIAWSGSASFRGLESRMAQWSVGSGEKWVGLAALHRGVNDSRSNDNSMAGKRANELSVEIPAPTFGASQQVNAGNTAVRHGELELDSSQARAGIITTGDPYAGSSQVGNGDGQTGPLVLHFQEDSWVEVRQADGKVLVSRLSHAGAEQSVSGAAPFDLVIGNAEGVVIEYRGKPVDLMPYTRARVARLTLN